jgi:hypothetical protein
MQPTGKDIDLGEAMKFNAENDKNALKVIMFTIACSDKMA